LKTRKKAGPSSPNLWTVEELGSFYVQNRSELFSHALRVLKDKARAEEVTQESLVKVMLGAPELESREHALAYLHRTIENLCIDIFRHEGRRPNLVLLDDATAEIEALWQQSDDHTETLAKAEDAAIVRQALAMLSPAERAALVMWEVEGRSTEEIAAELGVSPRTVRHTVSRARSSLRRVLSELVLDEVRGLTALDLLSTSYRKASEVVRNSSKVSLSLILVLFAFLGFNSMPSNVGISTLVSQKSSQDLGDAQSVSTVSTEVASVPSAEPVTASSPKAVSNQRANDKAIVPRLKFPGLDEMGVPIAFTAADSSGGVGTAYFRARPAHASDMALVSGQVIKTESGAANIFISQSLEFDEEGPKYNPIVAFGQGGSWVPLEVKVTSTEFSRQANGNYLLTAYIAVESVVNSPIKITATADGRDLARAPRQVITRLVLDPSKTQVLAQAVYIVERGAGV